MRKPTHGPESGQILTIVAVMLLAMLAILGLVVDSGLTHATRRQARRAADAAAQAGACSLCLGTNTTQMADARAAAIQYAGLNGVNTNGNVLVQVPPGAGSGSAYAGSNGYIFVQVTLPVGITFMRLFTTQRTVNVTAAATAGTAPTPVPVTLQALNPTRHDALDVSGNARINLPSGAIAVNSSMNDAISISGNARITASAINVTGDVSGPESHITGQLNTGVPTPSDPLTNVDEPRITSSSQVTYPDGYTPNNTSLDSGGTALSPVTKSIGANTTATLNPGIYWGGISLSGNATVTFRPGRYVLAGGGLHISGNASASGTNVFFYNTRDPYSGGGAAAYGSIDITGNGTINLKAPTVSFDPVYGGLLIFNDRANTEDINLTGNGSTGGTTGFIYGKSSELSVSGNGSVGNLGAIVDHASFSGNATMNAPGVAYTPATRSVQLME
ncbi:MAG: hypothetical protein HZC54_01840 [Verrucomicrobia bacterium]|nr:hypothetical protein [Verrucomicrobiota bacterium]